MSLIRSTESAIPVVAWGRRLYPAPTLPTPGPDGLGQSFPSTMRKSTPRLSFTTRGAWER